MLKIYTVTFFGHRYIDNIYKVKTLLEEQIRTVVNKYEYVDFIVGRNGDFDRCASSAVKLIQKEYRDDNNSLILLLPYPTAEYMNNQEQFEEYYNEIEISQKAAIAHPKAAIYIRNCQIIDRADLIICYIEHQCGGAYAAVKYAAKQQKSIINLADYE